MKAPCTPGGEDGLLTSDFALGEAPGNLDLDQDAVAIMEPQAIALKVGRWMSRSMPNWSSLARKRSMSSANAPNERC